MWPPCVSNSFDAACTFLIERFIIMLDDCIRATALDHLDAYPLHVAYEVEGSKKKPIQAENGYPADITNPQHLGTFTAAAEQARRLERNGKVAGCGIVLGCVEGKNLNAIDLDKCLDGDALAPWAQALLTSLKLTFVEKSLSGTGLHVYFYIAVEDRQWLLEKLGIEPGQWGKRRTINNGHQHVGPHGPALEIYTGKRYFARTDEIWPGHADVVATFDRSALENVIAAIREAWGEEGSQEGSQGGGSSEKWGEDRSADALRVAHALKHAGKARTLEEMMKGLLADPDPRIGAWVSEKGLDRNQHELKRLWRKIWPDGDPEPGSETPETPEAKVIARGAEVQRQRKAAGERYFAWKASYAALASDADPEVTEWINTHTEQDFSEQCWSKICKADGSFDYAGANGSASHEKEAPRRDEAESGGDNSFNSSFRSSYKWPELGEAALHGVAGDVVRAIKPHTEGDPVAILVQYLLAVGNAMGRSAYCMVEGTKHYGNLFCVIVGKSSKARKGTGWKRVLQIVHPADADWFQCVRSGLSTGEGLIWCLRDDQDGLIDKRLLVVEEEFAKACAVMERQGNTLSVVVRDAWDCNPLEVLTKQEPAKATNTHISIVGHITENELRQKLTETSMINGFANRFIFILAKRSNILPFGGDDLDESVL